MPSVGTEENNDIVNGSVQACIVETNLVMRAKIS